MQGCLRRFRPDTHDCGVFGNGSKLKFIANLLVTIHNLSAAEAIVLGERSGLDLDLLYEVIRDGAGTSRMFEVRAPLMIRNDYSRSDHESRRVSERHRHHQRLRRRPAAPDAVVRGEQGCYYAGAYARKYAKQDTASDLRRARATMAGVVRPEPEMRPRKPAAKGKTRRTA